jgi:hypothetical protein
VTDIRYLLLLGSLRRVALWQVLPEAGAVVVIFERPFVISAELVLHRYEFVPAVIMHMHLDYQLAYVIAATQEGMVMSIFCEARLTRHTTFDQEKASL